MIKTKKMIYVVAFCIVLLLAGFLVVTSSSKNDEKAIAIEMNKGPYDVDGLGMKSVLLKEKKDIERFTKAIDSISYDKVEDYKNHTGEVVYGPTYTAEIQYKDSQKNVAIFYTPSYNQIIVGDKVYILNESIEKIFNDYLKEY